MKLECRVWKVGCLPDFPRFVPIAPRLALLQELDLFSAPFLQSIEIPFCDGKYLKPIIL